MKHLIALITLALPLVSAAAALPRERPPRIIGLRCDSYWDHYRIAGVKNRYMDPIHLEDLSIDLIKPLMAADDAANSERSSIDFNVSIGDCEFSRQGPVLAACRPRLSVGDGLRFSYGRSLGNNHFESITIRRSIELENVRIDAVLKDASDEDGKIVNQVVYTLTADVGLADGRKVAYKHEKAFGPLKADNSGNSNWGRQCAFVTE